MNNRFKAAEIKWVTKENVTMNPLMKMMREKLAQ